MGSGCVTMPGARLSVLRLLLGSAPGAGRDRAAGGGEAKRGDGAVWGLAPENPARERARCWVARSRAVMCHCRDRCRR